MWTNFHCSICSEQECLSMTLRKFNLGAYSLRGMDHGTTYNTDIYVKEWLVFWHEQAKQVTGNYLRFDNQKLSENLIQKTANFASSKMFCLEASSSNTDFQSH